MDVARNTVHNLRHAPLHLGFGEVTVTVVDGFELRTVNRDARVGKETQPPTQFDELRTDFADRRPVGPAELGNRFVVGDETTQ